MRYRDAKRLHNEDEITVRKTGESHTVVNVDVLPNIVYIFCENGGCYENREVR